MRGAHGRLFTLVGAIAEVVDGWTPRPEHEDAARAALAVALTNTMAVMDGRVQRIGEALRRLGPGGADPRLAGLVRMLLVFDLDDGSAFEARLERLADDPDPYVARPALQWLGHLRENAADPAGAAEAIERALALADPQDGPWPAAILHTFMAQVAAQLGDRAGSAEHARRALPVMHRLGAKDDELQLRSMLALGAVADGRLADAEDELARIRAVDDGFGLFGSTGVQRTGRAELALARGDVATGLEEYRGCAEAMRCLRFPGVEPSGREPWTVFGEAAALTAHAHHASGADVAHGEALFASCRDRTLLLLEADNPYLDIPVVGLALFGLGSWALLRDAAAVEDAVALLALGDRLAYTRSVPTMEWERIVPFADPRLLSAAQERYARSRPRDLLDEARRLVRGVGGS
jgi:hypothetical protein